MTRQVKPVDKDKKGLCLRIYYFNKGNLGYGHIACDVLDRESGKWYYFSYANGNYRDNDIRLYGKPFITLGFPLGCFSLSISEIVELLKKKFQADYFLSNECLDFFKEMLQRTEGRRFSFNIFTKKKIKQLQERVVRVFEKWYRSKEYPLERLESLKEEIQNYAWGRYNLESWNCAHSVVNILLSLGTEEGLLVKNGNREKPLRDMPYLKPSTVIKTSVNILQEVVNRMRKYYQGEGLDPVAIEGRVQFYSSQVEIAQKLLNIKPKVRRELGLFSCRAQIPPPDKADGDYDSEDEEKMVRIHRA